MVYALVVFNFMFKSKKQKEKFFFYLLASLIVFLALFSIALIFIWSGQTNKRNGGVTTLQQNSQLESESQEDLTIAQKKFVKPIVAVEEPAASFSDIFSSNTWLNEDETTLLRNDSAMTLTFKPKIEIKDSGACPADFIKNNNCLGENCLEVKNNQLFYNQKLVILPDNDNILNIASLPVVDKWLVAGVAKKDHDYQPLLWWFDGQGFSSISLPLVNDKAPTIRYLGNFGLGNSGRSVLVLYSAEDGLAWQINGDEIRDISYLFLARANNGGFKPGIITFGQDRETIWYVYDATGERLRWLKFWQNNTDWIEGVISLANFLPSGTKQAVMSVQSGRQPNLSIAAYNKEKKCQFYSASDLGFIQEQQQVTSGSITGYNKSRLPINKARINRVLGGWSGFDNNWQLSFDDQSWHDVKIGQNLESIDSSGDLWWRWQVKPGSDNYNSPCLKMVNLFFWQ